MIVLNLLLKYAHLLQLQQVKSFNLKYFSITGSSEEEVSSQEVFFSQWKHESHKFMVVNDNEFFYGFLKMCQC